VKRWLLLLIVPMTAWGQNTQTGVTIGALNTAQPLSYSDNVPVWQAGNPNAQCATNGQCTFKTTMAMIAAYSAANITISPSQINYSQNIAFSGAQTAATSYLFQSGVQLSGTPTAPASGQISPFNIYIVNDAATPGAAGLSGMSLIERPGTGYTGGRNGLFVENFIVGAPASLGAGGPMTAGNFLGNLGANQGGTSGYANSQGSVWGLVGGVIQNSPYASQAIAEELDLTVLATTARKNGLLIVQAAGDVNRGTYNDAAIDIDSQAGAGTTWLRGISFGDYDQAWSFGADSTLIGAVQRTLPSTNSPIALNGVDFRAVAFQSGGYAFASTGFTVGPDGTLIAGAAATGATSTLMVENATNPQQDWWRTGLTNGGRFNAVVGNGTWTLRACNDAGGTCDNAIVVTRSTTAPTLSSIAYGNSTDNPAHNFYGSVNLNGVTGAGSSSKYVCADSSGNVLPQTTPCSNVLIGSSTLPTVTSGAGNTPTVAGNGTFFFAVTADSAGTMGTLVLSMPAAPIDWECTAIDRTPSTPVVGTQQGALSTNTVTIKWLNGTPSHSDVISVTCLAR